jgi:hypothetical protein
MFRSLLAVTPVLALLTGATVAQTSQNAAEPSATTSSKPTVMMGNVGSAASTTMAGSGGEGLFMKNGNGTSTLVTPGGNPMVVLTPR